MNTIGGMFSRGICVRRRTMFRHLLLTVMAIVTVNLNGHGVKTGRVGTFELLFPARVHAAAPGTTRFPPGSERLRPDRIHARFLNAGYASGGDESTAQGYYTQIAGVKWSGQKCQGQKCTLAGWKSANGFGSGTEVRAVYYNEGELGLARDVHCRQVNPVKVACYVTNYGSSIPADPLTALSDASAGRNPRETLAIEAARSFAQEGDTGFFVYSAAAGNPLSTSVALDNEGEKYVPNVCLACHGGEHSNQQNRFVGGTMLPFDVFTFSILSRRGISLTGKTFSFVRRIGGAGDSYQETFRQLNGLVLDSRGRSLHFGGDPATPENPSPTYEFGDPIRELIVGWYSSCNNLARPVNGSSLRQAQGCIADDGYLPSGWTDKPQLYQTVFRRYCRSCHNAQDHGIEFTAWEQFKVWSQPNNLGGIARLVCNIGGRSFMIMPNAEVTYNRFWSSSAPQDLKTQLSYPECKQQ